MSHPSFYELANAAPNFQPPADDDPASQNLFSDVLADVEPALLHRTWNWRDHMVLPHARNQGRWNACVSFAAAAMIEARRRLLLHMPTRLIPGHIHNCSLGINSPVTPSNPTQVLNACTAIGAASGQDDSMPVAAGVCASTSLVRISGWEWIMGRNNILNKLVTDGPMLVTMTVDLSFFNDRDGAVYSLPANPGQTLLHAVLLVGYDVDQGWASVLNSAGADWGVGGFGRVAIGSGGLITARSGAGALVA